MKPKPSLRSFLTLVGSSLLLASQMHAQGPYYWDNNGDTAGFGTASGTWSGTGSLFSTDSTGLTAPTGSVVTAAGETANFGTDTAGNGLGTGAITVDGDVVVGNLIFGTQTTGTITFDGVNGGTITTGNNTVRVNGTGATAIFNSDFVGATTQWFGASTTIYNGNFKNTGTSTIRVNHTLQFGSTATVDFNNGSRGINYLLSLGQTSTIRYSSNNDGLMGAVGNNGDSSSGVFLKDGSATSTLRLAANNTFLGEYRIEAGTLQFAVRNGLYNGVDTNWLATKIIVANTGALGINVGGTNRFTTGDVGTLLTNLGGANGTSTTGFAAGSAIAIDTTNAPGDQTVSSLIADSTGTGGGSFGVTKLGTNTLILDNVNTYTGATKVNGGTLALGSLASINNSANISIAAGATLDVSQQSSPFTLSANNTLSANGTGTTAAMWAQIIGPSGGAVSLGSQAVTLTWAGDTSGTGTDSPALVVSQGELTLNNNAFTINGSTLGLGTYRLIQVGDGATGTLNENGTPSYMVSGTSIDGTKTNVISSDGSGNLILTVTASGGGITFADWKGANGNPAGGLGDDHDGDGVDNGTEFFLGGDTDTTGFTALPPVVNTGGILSVTWTKHANYPGDYTTDFVVQTSETLADPWTTETEGVNVIITGADVKYTFPNPLGTKKFARLKVTGPN